MATSTSRVSTTAIVGWACILFGALFAIAPVEVSAIVSQALIALGILLVVVGAICSRLDRIIELLRRIDGEDKPIDGEKN